MANNLNVTIGVSGNVNGISVSQYANYTTTPTGSIIFEYSPLLATGSWQLVYTGSVSQPIGTIALYNTTATSGSVSLSTSSIGNPILLTANAGGAAIDVPYGAPLNALYAQSYVTQSTPIIVVIAA